MAVLHLRGVRGVPDELYEELRAEARAEGRSIGQHAILLPEQGLARRRQREEFMERLARFRERTRLPEGLPAPEDVIRRTRDGEARSASTTPATPCSRTHTEAVLGGVLPEKRAPPRCRPDADR